LLNVGRHFRLTPGTKVVVGRNQSENELLGTMREAPLVLITPVGFKGPSALAGGTVDGDAIDLIALILARYGKEGSPTVTVEVNDGSITRHVVAQRDVGIEAMMVTEER
jgi:tRNA-specific 2-thiouridylase